MGVSAVPASTNPPSPASRILPSAELAMARLAALNPNIRGCAVFSASGEQYASRGEPLVRESAGRRFWLDRAADTETGCIEKHATIPGGEFFGVRTGNLAMLALADPGTLPSLTLLDMQTILLELSRSLEGNSHTDRKAA